MAVVFNDPTFCDATVRVYVKGIDRSSGDSSGGESGCVDAADCSEFYVSSAMLAGSSSYFQRAFENWTVGGKDRKVIELHVDKSKEEALLTLVRYMHSKTFPLMGIGALLDLLEVADQYMVTECVAEMCTRLAEKKAEIVTTPLALRVMEISKRVVLSLHPAMTFAKEFALEALLSRFGDLEAVWAGQISKDVFMGLPCDVAVEILKSDKLRIGSENTVFLFATEWLEENFPDRSTSDLEYYQACMRIGAAVRFPHLSMNFLSVWAPEVFWMKDFSQMTQFWVKEALQYKVSGGKGKRLSQESCANNRFVARKLHSSRNVLSWVVHKDTVQEVLTSRRPVHSPHMFFAGYKWDIEIERKVISSKPHIGVYLFAHSVLDEVDTLVQGPLQIECSYALKAQKFGAQGGERVESLKNVKWDLGTGWGWQNFFLEDAAKILGEHSAYLDSQDRLHFHAVIESVN